MWKILPNILRGENNKLLRFIAFMILKKILTLFVNKFTAVVGGISVVHLL